MFNLKRQSIPEEIVKIISRQYKNRDLGMQPLTRKNLKEIEQIVEEIEQHGTPKHLIKKKLQGKLGFGMFLAPDAEPILRGQVIGLYAGEISLAVQNRDDGADYAFDPITDLRLTKEEQKKFDPENKYHPKRLYALKLDAGKKGNYTRFINHSEKPNVVAYLVSTKKNPYEIVYFAKKRINPGEQLLISYENGEKSYWVPLGIKPFPMTPTTFKIRGNEVPPVFCAY